MKYTRYDVKSKRKKDDWKTMIIMIVGVVILAVLIGSLVFFKVFPKGGELLGGSKKPSTQQGGNKNGGNTIPPVVADDKEKEEDATNQKDEENTAGKNDLITKAEESTYTMVQCGYFSKKESAEKVKNEVGSIAQVINEDEKFRVVSYIGEENKAQELSKTLTEKEIDNTKTRFTIATNTISNKAIKETIDGLLDISVKLAKDDISRINTKDFKAWTNSLKENKDDETYEVFKKLKDNINKLPEQLTKNDIEKVYQILFDIL
ncbi:MAG: hypothetical protein ACRCYE_12290, partial [Sarcina sp.]